MAYQATLDDIKLLADVTAQLDHIKNLIPAQCGAAQEAALLVDQGHDALTRILGADTHLVYSQEEMTQ